MALRQNRRVLQERILELSALGDLDSRNERTHEPRNRLFKFENFHRTTYRTRVRSRSDPSSN